jgi:hypothetical protein
VSDRVITPTGMIAMDGVKGLSVDGRYASHYVNTDGTGFAGLYRLDLATQAPRPGQGHRHHQRRGVRSPVVDPSAALGGDPPSVTTATYGTLAFRN